MCYIHSHEIGVNIYTFKKKWLYSLMIYVTIIRMHTSYFENHGIGVVEYVGALGRA